MPSITVFHYNCPICNKMQTDWYGVGILETCHCCGGIACKKCREYDLCPDCLKRMQPADLPLLKKYKKFPRDLEKRIEIYKRAFSPNYVIPGQRKDLSKFLESLKTQGPNAYVVLAENNKKETYSLLK